MTYYPDDIEAKNTWIALGVDPTHVIPREDNFWEIGSGPCGPDTEIYFDRGSSYDKRGKELIELDLETERFIEIWNIVFSQFNSKPGLKRDQYPELPNKNIDTGAGLERFACVIQQTKTNFETDLFFPIIKNTEQISKV
jgi:alanyl-tRNA synthetase